MAKKEMCNSQICQRWPVLAAIPDIVVLYAVLQGDLEGCGKMRSTQPPPSLTFMLSSPSSVAFQVSSICAKPSAPDLYVTEQLLRDLVKAQLPRLIRSRSEAFLVEEMEVCLGQARVDLAVIADHLIGIEIKGPKDDVSRLPRQVQAYSRCFDRVILVVHESLAERAKPLVPGWWGMVIAHEKDGECQHYLTKRPRPNPDLDLDAVLSLLWRDEIDALLADLLGATSKPTTTKKRIRAELLARIEAPVLHNASLDKLRHRTEWRGVPVHA